MDFDDNEGIDRELNYIRKEVLAKQKNDRFCKYSRIAKSITATNFTQDQYINYWVGTLKNRRLPKKEIDRVVEAIIDKFENDLTDLSVVVKLEKLSNDQEKDKADIIKEITTSK